jgi:CheY-like chemotaxis protein
MMSTEFSFIVIDDSELDCFVIQKVIKHFDQSLDVETFQNPQLALDIIRGNKGPDRKFPAIILLDIQMPVMNGFQFIEEFEKLPTEIQNNYLIIILSILSSTRSPIDIYRKFTEGIVNSIIDKPLTVEKLFSLLTRIRSAGLTK